MLSTPSFWRGCCASGAEPASLQRWVHTKTHALSTTHIPNENLMTEADDEVEGVGALLRSCVLGEHGWQQTRFSASWWIKSRAAVSVLVNSSYTSAWLSARESHVQMMRGRGLHVGNNRHCKRRRTVFRSDVFVRVDFPQLLVGVGVADKREHIVDDDGLGQSGEGCRALMHAYLQGWLHDTPGLGQTHTDGW